MKKLLIKCLIAICVIAFPSGLALAAESADMALKSAKAIFEARCSLCHATSRPLGKKKTPAQWSKTVTRMQKKAPNKISDADVKAILAYLNAVQGAKR